MGAPTVFASLASALTRPNGVTRASAFCPYSPHPRCWQARNAWHLKVFGYESSHSMRSRPPSRSNR